LDFCHFNHQIKIGLDRIKISFLTLGANLTLVSLFWVIILDGVLTLFVVAKLVHIFEVVAT
jgi:hypothetical protein